MGFFSFLKYTFIIFVAQLATSCGAPFENHWYRGKTIITYLRIACLREMVRTRDIPNKKQEGKALDSNSQYLYVYRNNQNMALRSIHVILILNTYDELCRR
jgi:hypothetical protein